MRNDNDVGNDLKAMAQDVMHMGARCVQAGRAWLTERRNDMTDRNDEYRPGNPAANPATRAGQKPGQGQGGQQSHVAEEWAARDYSRSQLQGQQGLEREYGTRFDRGYEETRRDESAPRGYRNPEAGSDRYQQQNRHEFQSYGGRQAGEGYGRSSGYGNPQQDRYAGDGGYGGTSFVSPADTQLGHSGLDRQSYSGMGPKNYKRSDERITEDLCERLTQDHDIDASELEVRIADGTATLDGTVPQRWMKHRAEDLADGCAGVRTVENRIKVQSAGAYSGASSQRDTGGGTDTPTSQGQGQSQRPGGTAH